MISGPSGTGKSTIIRRVLEEVDGIGYSVSHTTRAPRENEMDGLDYHFIDREKFRSMIRDGDFLEWAEVYNDLYGTSLSGLRGRMETGMDVIMDVDVQGAGNVRRNFQDAILIFLLPPSIDALDKRLRARGTESEDAIRIRIEGACREIVECRVYDYIVFNDTIPDAVQRLRSIIIAERCRSPRLMTRVRETFHIQ